LINCSGQGLLWDKIIEWLAGMVEVIWGDCKFGLFAGGCVGLGLFYGCDGCYFEFKLMVASWKGRRVKQRRKHGFKEVLWCCDFEMEKQLI
jgi:hypothetical protein